MIDGINNSPANNLGGQTGGESEGVDKESFLKLLVAQLQHQDPLSPMEGTEFVAQLAQFSMVEQAITQSHQLELVSLQLTGLASNEAVSLIGKQVTIQGDTINFDGQSATGFGVTLSEPAAEVTVTIRDANGNVVKTIPYGESPAGALSVPWDGTDNNGNPAAAGNYSVTVSALDADGGPVSVSQEVSGVVVGVSFEKGYPELELSTGAKAPISDLVSVSAAEPVTP